MDVGIGVRALVVIFAFFWVLAANNSQGIRHFSDILSEENIPDIDEEKVEEVWHHCTRELIESTRGNANLIFYLSEVAGKNENVKLDRPERVKQIMQTTINDLPTRERYFLLECLRSEAILHNEYSMTWISKCQNFFSRWSNIPRRFLKGGRKHHNHHRSRKHHHGRSSSRNHHHPLALEMDEEEGPSPSPNNEVPASSPNLRLNLHKEGGNPPGGRAPASSPSIILSQLSLDDSAQPIVPKNAPSPAPSNGDHPLPTASPPSPTASPPSTTLSPPPPMPSPPSTTLSPPPPTPSLPSPTLSPPPPTPSPPTPEPSSPSPVPKPIVETPPVQPPPKSSSSLAPPKSVERPPPSTAQTEADSPSGGGKQKDGNNTIAVSVLGGLAALLGLALVFACIVIKRREKTNPVDGQSAEGKYDKPLLFNSSDVSAASSQQSGITGKPGDKLSKTSSAVGGNLESEAQNSSKLETQSSEAALGTNGSLLPLPPGKSAPPVVAAPPPPPPPKPAAPRAPPPPKMARPPPNPPKNGKPGPSPLGGPHHRGKSSLDEGESGDPDAPKTKLKPFFWDKVNANPDHSMVWHEIKEGSFQFNEEMMESLFGYIPADKAKNENKDSSKPQSQPTQIRIIEPKKAQNLSILLKALNVTTEEVCDALKEGNELPLELMQTLLKMAPTTDEELKLRLFSGDLSQLGPAERFLKVVVDIPFAFKRLEALLFMCSLQEEVSSVKESFNTLEVACNELKNSRLFLKLLEAVLKTGNRMNDGTFRGGAMAFKLDTLLKLSDVKGTDGKTTLLLFVVQEIIRSEGIRAARKLRESQSMSNFKPEDLSEGSTPQETEECHRKLGLEVVSGLSSELEDVKKAAVLDGEIMTATVSKLGVLLTKTKAFLENELKTVEDAGELCEKLAAFLEKAEADTAKLIEDDKRIMELVRSTGDYFHGNSGKDEGLRLFTVVRDFLVMLDKVCREVRSSAKWTSKPSVKKESVSESSPRESPQETHTDSLNEARRKLFPAIQERRMDSDDDSSSSDDDSS